MFSRQHHHERQRHLGVDPLPAREVDESDPKRGQSCRADQEGGFGVSGHDLTSTTASEMLSWPPA